MTTHATPGTLRLLFIAAHPDDESLGCGGSLAKYAAEGIETHLVTATRGERGWFGDERENPGLEALGKLRAAELRAATARLGVHSLSFLDYVDGELDEADSIAATNQIAYHLRRVRPHVVVTFDPTGAYGHPDHIAICQLTAAAIIAAADCTVDVPGDLPPHRVPKFYYRVDTPDQMVAYQAAFGDLVMHIDGVERRAVGWPAWSVTTVIDTEAYWPVVWEAVSCHRSQLPGYAALSQLSEANHRALWGAEYFYRVHSLVNGGRVVENDLFAGLR